MREPVDKEQSRRIRRALWGRGELTRADAEFLSRRESGLLGWLFRRSGWQTALGISFILLWGLFLTMDIVRHRGIVHVVIAAVMILVGLLGEYQSRHAERVLERAWGAQRSHPWPASSRAQAQQPAGPARLPTSPVGPTTLSWLEIPTTGQESVEVSAPPRSARFHRRGAKRRGR